MGAGEIVMSADEHADAASLFGGELQSPRFDVAKRCRRSDRRGDGGTAQALHDGPQFVGWILNPQQKQAPYRNRA
jgi:hypothetical protein